MPQNLNNDMCYVWFFCANVNAHFWRNLTFRTFSVENLEAHMGGGCRSGAEGGERGRREGHRRLWSTICRGISSRALGERMQKNHKIIAKMWKIEHAKMQKNALACLDLPFVRAPGKAHLRIPEGRPEQRYTWTMGFRNGIRRPKQLPAGPPLPQSNPMGVDGELGSVILRGDNSVSAEDYGNFNLEKCKWTKIWLKNCVVWNFKNEVQQFCWSEILKNTISRTCLWTYSENYTISNPNPTLEKNPGTFITCFYKHSQSISIDSNQ